MKQQISKSHIPIHHSQSQVTVAHNGKKERVFVDLRAVYPTPDEAGTELSFEEVWAANRGWLDQDWTDKEESVLVDVVVDERSEVSQVELLGPAPPQKMAIHHDVIRLDENGAPIFPKEGKSKKKKKIEVNETQISTSLLPFFFSSFLSSFFNLSLLPYSSFSLFFHFSILPLLRL
jgi:checkpoint serine/threonine-protein kinase